MPSLTYEISVTGPGLDVVHCAAVSPPITTDHGPVEGRGPITPQAVAQNRFGKPDG